MYVLTSSWGKANHKGHIYIDHGHWYQGWEGFPTLPLPSMAHWNGNCLALPFVSLRAKASLPACQLSRFSRHLLCRGHVLQLSNTAHSGTLSVASLASNDVGTRGHVNTVAMGTDSETLKWHTCMYLWYMGQCVCLLFLIPSSTSS